MASIYDIDQRIQECIDFETGEIIDAEKLDELQIEREQKIENIACWIKNLKSEAESIKAEEKALADRRGVKERKVESLKDYLKYVLDGAPFESPRVQIGFRQSKAVNILDESIIPEEFIKTETVTKIDKKLLGEALKQGIAVDGAELLDNSNIQIK